MTFVGLTKSVTTYPLDDRTVGYYAMPRTLCTKEPGAERGKLLGYDVVKVTRELKLATGEVMRIENWQAPALNCFTLAEAATKGPADGPQLRTTKEVVAIFEGDPSPSLFETPTGYTERSPSQATAEWTRLFPGQSSCCDESMPKLDDAYMSHQVNR